MSNKTASYTCSSGPRICDRNHDTFPYGLHEVCTVIIQSKTHSQLSGCVGSPDPEYTFLRGYLQCLLWNAISPDDFVSLAYAVPSIVSGAMPSSIHRTIAVSTLPSGFSVALLVSCCPMNVAPGPPEQCPMPLIRKKR